MCFEDFFLEASYVSLAADAFCTLIRSRRVIPQALRLDAITVLCYHDDYQDLRDHLRV